MEVKTHVKTGLCRFCGGAMFHFCDGLSPEVMNESGPRNLGVHPEHATV